MTHPGCDFLTKSNNEAHSRMRVRLFGWSRLPVLVVEALILFSDAFLSFGMLASGLCWRFLGLGFKV